MSERDLLVDCLRRLNGAKVAYMLAGSMASNYYMRRWGRELGVAEVLEEVLAGHLKPKTT